MIWRKRHTEAPQASPDVARLVERDQATRKEIQDKDPRIDEVTNRLREQYRRNHFADRLLLMMIETRRSQP